MNRKAVIILSVIMLIGTITTSCVDKKENQNTPIPQQERRDQRNQQRDSLNPFPVDRINPDGTRG